MHKQEVTKLGSWKLHLPKTDRRTKTGSISENLLLMGKEFWKASGTYTTKINPSNSLQAKYEENEQHRQPQQYNFLKNEAIKHSVKT